jgi:hypothetical protein
MFPESLSAEQDALLDQLTASSTGSRIEGRRQPGSLLATHAADMGA